MMPARVILALGLVVTGPIGVGLGGCAEFVSPPTGALASSFASLEQETKLEPQGKTFRRAALQEGGTRVEGGTTAGDRAAVLVNGFQDATGKLDFGLSGDGGEMLAEALTDDANAQPVDFKPSHVRLAAATSSVAVDGAVTRFESGWTTGGPGSARLGINASTSYWRSAVTVRLRASNWRSGATLRVVSADDSIDAIRLPDGRVKFAAASGSHSASPGFSSVSLEKTAVRHALGKAAQAFMKPKGLLRAKAATRSKAHSGGDGRRRVVASARSAAAKGVAAKGAVRRKAANRSAPRIRPAKRFTPGTSRLETAKQDTIRQEMVRREAVRQEAAREEPIRQEPVRREESIVKPAPAIDATPPGSPPSAVPWLTNMQAFGFSK